MQEQVLEMSAKQTCKLISGFDYSNEIVIRVYASCVIVYIIVSATSMFFTLVSFQLVRASVAIHEHVVACV